MHQICTKSDNFFTNIFQLLKMTSNYRDLALNVIHKNNEVNMQKEAIDVLKEMKSRKTKRHDKTDRKVLTCSYDILKISSALRELLKRSDIMD